MMHVDWKNRKATLRTIAFIFVLAIVVGSPFLSAIGKLVFAENKADGQGYEIYVDTSMVGADSGLLKDGIGVYLYDELGNAGTRFPIAMTRSEKNAHLFYLALDRQYTYAVFTRGTNPFTEERTEPLLIDWSLGAPVYRLHSENPAEGGSFYGRYTVYFDLNDAAGSETFRENGVGVYAYNSETESCSALPLAMHKSGKGENIYEYCFDRPYEFIAFMDGFNTWDYGTATEPVYVEWEYEAPCFLLEKVDGEASTGCWRSLNCVIYFDASELEKEEAFVENGVYLYAYNEKENGEKDELRNSPVKMLASAKGEQLYEYTLDQPYANIQFLLGDSFEAEIQSELLTIDWLYYAAPCYKMTVDRKITLNGGPTASPSASPSLTPSISPSTLPEEISSASPSVSPEEPLFVSPSAMPEVTPSVNPSRTPETAPTIIPEETPEAGQTPVPTEMPEAGQTPEPAETPSTEPVEEPQQVSGRDVIQPGTADYGSYRMKWLGTGSELTVQPVSELLKESPTPTPEQSSAGTSDSTQTQDPSETPDPAQSQDPSETSTPTQTDNTSETPDPSQIQDSSETAAATPAPDASAEVDGELKDLAEGTATKAARSAALGLVAFSSTELSGTSGKTVYFDTGKNNDGTNGWTENCQMYIYLIGSSGSIQPMTRSQRTNTLSQPEPKGTLWEYTIPEDVACTGVIFVTQSSWAGKAVQTENVVFADKGADGRYPCFALDGGYVAGSGEKTVSYLGDLGSLSQAGKPMYFVDMTSSVQGVYAMFSGGENESIKVNPTGGGAGIAAYFQIPTAPGETTTPENGEGTPYTTVTFYDQNDMQLGESCNFFNQPGEGETGFAYDAVAMNTFYYGVTEKPGQDQTKLSTWGAQPTANEALAGKKLYFDKLFFQVDEGGSFQVGTGEQVVLTADANDENTFSYIFADDAVATQQTILTYITSDKTRYHFLWTKLTETAEGAATPADINKVTLNDEIANVTGTYEKGNSIYFDAALSKLYYSKEAKGDYGIPKKDGTIRFYATGPQKPDLEGNMTPVKAYTKGGNTWCDVYKAELPDGYTEIAFSSFDMSSITNYGGSGESTAKLTIPADLKNPCFYADTSDDIIYGSGTRNGYWDEVFRIRDPEKEGGSSQAVVDIPSGTETRERDKLYLSTTFYDFYTDYELNGRNRDNYASVDVKTHRIYQPFRQFDQALSAFYENNGAAHPLYWGNFQNYSGSHFSEIAGDLNLYDYAGNSKKFFYENNSMWDLNGNEINAGGQNTTLGLVSDELQGGKLMIETAGGTKEAPFFSEQFLSGENAKNTVLGKVYRDVSFPFTQRELKSQSAPGTSGTVKYWVFDSKDSTTNLRLQQDTGTGSYYLATTDSVVRGQTTSGQTAQGNFFPFNDGNQSGNAAKLNYGFASKIEFKFRLTADGTVETSNQEKVPIEFNFSGDDDVWVFIDNKLALDIGGGHGVVTGYLNFKDLTYYIDKVKKDSGFESGKTGSFTLGNGYAGGGKDGQEHTLTMFYMERGLWESNMYISFNFPDENQLEVEKQVDETAVNQELFQGVFADASIFPFTIQNLATHYGTKEVDFGEKIDPVPYNDTFKSGLSSASASNKMEHVDSHVGKTDVAHWYAQYYDTAAGNYLDKRWGTIPPGSGDTVNAGNMKYLQFTYYADAVPSLNKMYVGLVDSTGAAIGGYLSGKVHGASSMKKGTWETITVDLEKLQGNSSFNFASVKDIRFSYNDPVNFYLDDFTFLPAATVSKLTGFITKQYEIPDYASAGSGKLEPAYGALYTLTDGDGNSEYCRVDQKGQFVLADREVALFRDQFRRGSYIALQEEADQSVFATTWTMYEDGLPVTDMSEGTTITLGSTRNLKDIASSMAVDDDRTEVYKTGTEDGKTIENGGYTSSHRPEAPAFVFRSYANPDADKGLTKLRVTYTNRVRVGSLKLTKSKAEGSDPLNGEYHFLVSFTNVAGMGLEGEQPIIKEIILKNGESEEITGIPVGTEFTITEIPPEDKSFLKNVTGTLADGAAEYTFDPETKELKGKIGNENQAYDFTFENMLKPVISIDLTKKWENAGGGAAAEDIPDKIRIRVQRRPKAEQGTQPEAWQDFNIKYQEILTQEEWSTFVSQNNLPDTEKFLTEDLWSPGYNGWTRSFKDLNKYVDNTNTTKVLWEYRIVEVDPAGSGMIAENGGVLGNFQITYSGVVSGTEEADGDAGSVDDEAYGYIITNTRTVTLEILKKNKTDQPIAGVSFRLAVKKKDAEGKDIWEVVAPGSGDGAEAETDETAAIVTTDKEGKCSFQKLAYGTYRLTEVGTAEGYTLLKDPVIIEITKDGYRLGSGAIADGAAYTTIENNVVSVTIVNPQNLVLPPTGGRGRLPFAAGGMLLCGMAGLLYMDTLHRRRKGEKAS